VLQLHRRIQPRLGGAEGDGEGIAAGDFVAEHEQQEVGMRQRLLAREDEALGQRVEQASEF
jgi:hypothetical protein